MIVFLNGRWLAAKDAQVSIDDAGLLHADGVFETALLRAGKYFRLAPHLARLAESAGMLALEPPPADFLTQVAHELATRNRLRDGTLRITLTRGTGDRPTLFVTLRPIDPDWRRRADAGWTLITARTRRPSSAAMPAQLKALGRTYALLARAEARAAGADDALLLTDDGRVCEGPTWNLFWRRGRDLFTPDLSLGVLAGLTRAVLLELAPGLGFPVHETCADRAELDLADELFATMTSVGPVVIRTLDGRPLAAPATAAAALRTAYWELVDTEGGAPE